MVPHLPDDLTVTRVSRTTDRWRVVDEMRVAFTHDRELPWLLPGVAPTGRTADVLAIALVSFPRGHLEGVRVLWDLATLSAQLGVATPAPACAGAPATAR